MNTSKSYMLCFILITLLTAVTSCKQDISREAFAGLKLGIKAKEFRNELASHPKFRHSTFGDYYSFMAGDFRAFYSMPRPRVNEDSIVTAMTFYMCQDFTHIKKAGREEDVNPIDVYLNLKSYSADAISAPEEEIYNYLKKMLEAKYKVQKMEYEQLNEMSIDRYTSIYANDDDLVITLDRIVSPGVSTAPIGRIKLTYEFSDNYLSKYNIVKNLDSRGVF